MSNLCDVGVDPRTWYPAVRTSSLKVGTSQEVKFQERSFVVYKDPDGGIHCAENACAHRQVALSEGTVSGCRLVCPYHGWEFDPDGSLAKVPYWPADRPIPKVRIKTYPTLVRGGIVWFLPEPGETLPPLPQGTEEWETPEWFSFELDQAFDNHYGIGLINGMDYFHFHLHREYQPWSDIQLKDLEAEEGRVCGTYEVATGKSRPERVLRQLLGSDSSAEEVVNTLKVHYHYPHHVAELGDGMRVIVSFRPESRERVAVFITMYVKAHGWQRQVRKVFEPAFRRLVLSRIQKQDAWIGRIEQEAWETRPDEPRCELNPVAAAAERLMRSSWRAYQEQSGAPVKARLAEAVVS
ncbi:phenylpropionate dioxygenase-like ring-hydroxylating dioxygenase large terminal subunit [Streptomyces sp. 846.5]|nr:Rieske 2Fe-2S domain-containing protein [Streptomyces sp. 846.5]TDU04465.1 phenylpropionate dioxygenase-like ring-hydroxylating dioxygenase large terminal subunit [Streptomyces sp. 846.5]